MEAVGNWAEHRPDVSAVILVGSMARTQVPADHWSDVDLVLFVDDPHPYMADDIWIGNFGRPILTYLEPSPVEELMERRVVFEGGLDADFVFCPIGDIQRLLQVPDAIRTIARGYRVITDKVDLGRRLADVPDAPLLPNGPATQDLAHLSDDFWYHALWAAKKLRRGELLVAKRTVDGYLKERLFTLLEWHARAGDPLVDVWHDRRFFERWADPRAVDELRGAYATYDPGEIVRALRATADLFEWVERETTLRIAHADPDDRSAVRVEIDRVLGQKR